jgi:hypothetical protein
MRPQRAMRGSRGASRLTLVDDANRLSVIPPAAVYSLAMNRPDELDDLYAQSCCAPGTLCAGDVLEF